MERYELFPKDRKALTFAKGMQELKKAGYSRPLSFDEVIRARVEEYEGGGRSLLDHRIDTCTGVFYKGDSPLIKIVRIDPSLININPDCVSAYLKSDYNEFEGFEFNRHSEVFNQFLSKSEVLEHPVWKFLVPDTELLKAYTDIVFHEKGNPEQSMGVWIRQTKEFTTSRAMFVDDVLNESVAYCINYLFDNARFLVSPKNYVEGKSNERK